MSVRIPLIIATLIALGSTARADSTPEQLFTEAQAAYDQHDYATAVVKWQESYRLSGEGELLFDIAQAMRLSGDCHGAIASYRRFVEVARIDQADQAAMAKDFMRELERWCREPPPPPVVNKVTIDPKALESITAQVGQPLLEQARREEEVLHRRSRRLKIAGLGLGGAGLAAITAGVALGHHGAVLGDEVTTACQTSCNWTAEKSTDAAGRRDVAIGYAIDGLGAAAVIGGGIAYYLGIRGGVVEPREGGAVVSLRRVW
jgi:hypothetical protein